MGYSGPAVDQMRLHFPYENNKGDPDWTKVIIERSNTAPDMAFYRGALIGFRIRPEFNWVLRDVKQVGYPEQERDGAGPRSSRVTKGDEVREQSPDLDDFMTYLDGKVRGRTRVLHDDADFWKLYEEATTHPEVLLDIAARQAFESLKDL